MEVQQQLEELTALWKQQVMDLPTYLAACKAVKEIESTLPPHAEGTPAPSDLR